MKSKVENRSKDRDGLHRRRGIWYWGTRDPVTGKWHEYSTGTKNFIDARKIRKDKMEELARGAALSSDKRKLRLADAFNCWIIHAALEYAPNTTRLHRERSKPLLKELGKLRLEEFSIDTIRTYQRTRHNKVANRTINLEVQTLRNVLKHNDLWTGKLAEQYKSLPEPEESIGRALSDEEEQRCWEVAKRSQHSMRTYNVSVLLGNTGMRKMELLTVRLAQIDLEQGEIWVPKSKTKAGRRYIPLNEHAIVAATILVELAKRKGASKPEHYLFPAFLHRRRKAGEKRTGYDPTQHQRTLRTAWRNFVRKCGLRGLRLHDRRHHFITLLAEAGVPIEVAMPIVGHMSTEITRQYTHIRDGAKRNVVRQIDSANVVTTDELKRGYDAAKKRSRISDGESNRTHSTPAASGEKGLDHQPPSEQPNTNADGASV